MNFGRGLVAVAVAVATAGLGVAPAFAASAPAPVSHIVVTERTAHRVGISFSVPAAYYDTGAGGVVRVTRGYTPAASASAGYAVPVTGHTARTTASPTLTADVVYTFALWVRDGGRYSARRTATIRTRPDDVSNVRANVGFDGPKTQGGFTTYTSNPHVQLTWTNPPGQPLSQIRIVRNTALTTTGGKVITLSGSTHSYSDSHIVTQLCGATQRGGCSTAPVHYWILPKTTTNDYAEHYVRNDVVVGSATLSGTIASKFDPPYVLCCPNSFDGGAEIFGGSAAISGGNFTMHLVPGTFAVCAEDTTNHTDRNTFCWHVDQGNANGELDDGHDITIGEDHPLPSIDLVHHTSYTEVAFA